MYRPALPMPTDVPAAPVPRAATVLPSPVNLLRSLHLSARHVSGSSGSLRPSVTAPLPFPEQRAVAGGGGVDGGGHLLLRAGDSASTRLSGGAQSSAAPPRASGGLRRGGSAVPATASRRPAFAAAAAAAAASGNRASSAGAGALPFPEAPHPPVTIGLSHPIRLPPPPLPGPAPPGGPPARDGAETTHAESADGRASAAPRHVPAQQSEDTVAATARPAAFPAAAAHASRVGRGPSLPAGLGGGLLPPGHSISRSRSQSASPSPARGFPPGLSASSPSDALNALLLPSTDIERAAAEEHDRAVYEEQHRRRREAELLDDAASTCERLHTASIAQRRAEREAERERVLGPLEAQAAESALHFADLNAALREQWSAYVEDERAFLLEQIADQMHNDDDERELDEALEQRMRDCQAELQRAEERRARGDHGGGAENVSPDVQAAVNALDTLWQLLDASTATVKREREACEQRIRDAQAMLEKVRALNGVDAEEQRHRCADDDDDIED